MLEILFSWLSIPRTIGIWIDSIAFSLVDNVYDLIYEFASVTFFEESMILTIMNNTYIAISIFALFRIALILVNAMINPDKLSDKENGIGSVLRNLVIMFVLLIFTPLLFREAYYIQSKVVEGNYIQKIFLTNNAQSDSAGMEMKKIAMGALVHPDEAFATYDFQTKRYIPKQDCTGKCEEAVTEYNTMMESDAKGMFSVFTKHIGRTKKVNGETVYVYSYMFVVTFVVGVFITYILFTFGLDIAIRAVELAVLQMIAPLFIVTYIDPKSAKTGPFHKWLKTVGKTYVSLFIKLAILSLMTMFISLIDQIKVSDNVGFIGKLVILLAILIFAKKAPKWIGEMIGVDGESSGLGGLGKKIGSAALVGGALTKAGHMAAGAVVGGAAGVHNQLRNRRATRKTLAAQNGLNKGIGKKARNARRDWYDDNGLSNATYAQKRKALRAARKDVYGKDGSYGGYDKDGNLANKSIVTGIKQIGASIAGGVIGGGRAGVKAENMKGVFSGSINAANQFGKEVGLKGEGIGTKITNAFDSAYTGVKGAYGTAADINQRIKDAEDAKNFDSYFSSKSGFKSLNDSKNTPVGQGDFNKAFQGAKGDFDAITAAIGAKCIPELKDAKISTDKDGIITVSNGSYSMKIDGGNKTIVDGDGVSHSFSSISKTGKDTFSNEGLANYENMFAEAQRQAINSTIGNNTQMSALMQQRSNAEQSISYNTSEAMKIVAGAGLVIDGKIEGTEGRKIELADATMDDLKYAMNEAQKKSPGNEHIANAASEVEKRADSCEKSGNVINNINTQIGYYEESNAKLGNMIATLRDEDGNQTKTLDELLVIAEKKKEKKQKAVDAYEQQKTDEKK